MQSQEQAASPLPSPRFSMTESAAARINHLKTVEGNASLRFRVLVKGGGCSGFQYEFSLDAAEPADDDTVTASRGAEAVIDEVSLNLIHGSVLDYEEDLAQAGFVIKNPQATARCGCGNSFSVAL